MHRVDEYMPDPFDLTRRDSGEKQAGILTSGVGDRPSVRETGSVTVAGGSVDVADGSVAVAGGSVAGREDPRSNLVAAVIVSLLRLSLEFEAIETTACTWERSTSFSR
ncbi:unnamed protein product [Cuscuta epithymum]|uniref:Uncharacterized protein n=1 Tax=Cuscuta epithymum TaxID=186058 RepID=A0AAV0CN70_9ASTE|nr:unnamed protein product [Cuscuta epithymum]